MGKVWCRGQAYSHVGSTRQLTSAGQTSRQARTIPRRKADFEKECFRYTYENITQIPLYAQSEFTIMGEGFVSWGQAGFLDSTRHDRLVFEK